MISETTKALLDTVIKLRPNNPEDYVVVVARIAYEDLVREQDHVVFSSPTDAKSFPDRLCGMDVFVDDRIPSDVYGYIMPREAWERAKAQLDSIERWHKFIVDNRN